MSCRDRRGYRGRVSEHKTTPVSARILPLQPPGGRKRPNSYASRSQGSRPPPCLSHRNGGSGERRPHESQRGGLPPTLPNGHAPLKDEWVNEAEAQGVRLPKKLRRRRSRKVEPEERAITPPAETEYYRRMKKLPTAPQTIPQHNVYIIWDAYQYLYTSHMSYAGPNYMGGITPPNTSAMLL